MNTDEKVKYWIDLSDYDRTTAEAMLEMKRFLYVGIICHQSIEKLLKALFVHVTQAQPPRTHNLTRLARKGKIYDDLSDHQKDFLDLLEPLNIEARYPTHKEKLLKTLDEPRCTEILFKTRSYPHG
ncbi:HEPN domain-containing protein [Salicibibacter cibarius]|uniref:HEPN domain-containing protein n=1 Tax=Salicibibacter cibarius TaxID=2743000 RepID=UPI0019087E66|nr:HEPN domain-containing protein [Salicibibacter cibarius]